MTRAIFEQHLQELKQDVLELGSMVEKAIHHSVDGLKRRDIEASQLLMHDDMYVNEKRFEIEEKCIHVLATQQPMAVDLRFIIAVLHIIVDLERMGDHAVGVARINVRMGNEPLLKPLIDIPRMADKATEMLRRSLQAFIDSDVEEAKRICVEDDIVDDLNDQVFQDLISYMIKDPGTTERATLLIWAAHNLERIADRSTNIAERVVFTVTGKMEEIGASKY